MAYDVISRATAVRALRRQPRSPEDGGGAAGAPPAQNRAAVAGAFTSVAPDKFALTAGSYALDAIPVTDPVTLHRPGQQPSIMIPTSLKQLDLRNGELKVTNTRGVIAAAYHSYAYPCLRSYLAADVAAGDTTLTLKAGDGAKWTVGDEFLYRLGSFTYDLPEALQWGFGKIRAIAGDVVTIDAPMPAPFALTSVDGLIGDGSDSLSFTGEFGDAGSRNKSLHRWSLHKDLEICNGAITGDLSFTSETALNVNGGKRVSVRNVVIRNFGVGIIMQYVDRATISNCAVYDCNAFAQSVGKGFSFAEVRGASVDSCYFEGLKACVALEAGSEAWVNAGRFHNTGDPKTKISYGSSCTAFSAGGLSQLVVRDFTITGYGGYLLAALTNGVTQYDGRARFEGRLTLIHPTLPLTFGAWEGMNCVLDMTIAGTREIWDFTQARWFRRRAWLKNGAYNYLNLPAGILKAVNIYTSSGIAGGDVLAICLGRPGLNGNNYASSLVAGQQIRITPSALSTDPLVDKRSQPLKLLVSTAAGTALDAGDQFIEFACLIAPNLLAPGNGGLTDLDVRNGGENNRGARFVNTSIPVIAAGATWQTTYPIAAMAAGDLVEALSYSPNRAGVTIRDSYAILGGCIVIYENRDASASSAQTSTLIIEWRKPPADG